MDPNEAVEALGLEAFFETSKRLGVRKHGYNRPVLVTLDSVRHADEVLGKSHLLRHTEKFKSVFVSPDRTIERRQIRICTLIIYNINLKYIEIELMIVEGF